MTSKLQYRSKNPDLLFNDIMKYAIKDVTKFSVCYKNGDLPKEMERVTIFVTHRCNFLCKYCNGAHTNFNNSIKKKKRKMLSKDLSLEQFKIMLKDWKKHRCKHIHFTGGEPTLNEKIPEMVKLTTKSKILSSITTNGSANPSIYRKLIENGMTEIRISIDASNQKDFDNIVGIKGYFKKVTQNIKEIEKMRDKEKKDVFLVLNCCIGTINIKKIVRTLKFLISLNPNDIKFLVIAMERQKVAKQYNKKVIRELNKLLKPFPKDRFPLLRDKIKKLFNANAIGLKDKKAQQIMKHCYLPLRERTIDGNYYYPCSIYVRGYGKPIGKITELFEKQQIKSMNFTKYHNCRKDKICSRICTNCCKMFNIHVNEEISKIKKFELKKNISTKEINDVKKKILSLLKNKDKSRTKKWFIIIKPFGKKYSNAIKNYLIKQGIRIHKTMILKNWRSVALYLYCWPLSKERIKRSIELDKAFNKLERNKAEILYLEREYPEEKIRIVKEKLRELFVGRTYLLKTKGNRRLFRLNRFHIPDKTDLHRENTILNNFI